MKTKTKCFCEGVIKDPRCTHTLKNCWVKHISHDEIKILNNGKVGLGTTQPNAIFKINTNKIYEALMVEKETRQKFKEKKPKDKTNTEYLLFLMNKQDERRT